MRVAGGTGRRFGGSRCAQGLDTPAARGVNRPIVKNGLQKWASQDPGTSDSVENSVGLIFAVEFREFFLQVLQLRQIVVDDIGLVRVALQVVLMILLGAIKGGERRDLRDDLPG